MSQNNILSCVHGHQMFRGKGTWEISRVSLFCSFFVVVCFSMPDKAIRPFTRISVLTLWFSHHRSSLLLLLLLLRFDFRGFQNKLRVKTFIVSFTLLNTQQQHLGDQVFVSSPGVKVGGLSLVRRYILEPSKKNHRWTNV